jgi:hypothetical protein
MAITHEDITELKRVFDDRYVRIDECSDKQERINKKLANDDKRIDMILLEQKQMRQETKSGLKLNNWLTTAVLGVIIAGVIGFIYMNFGG